LEYLVKDENLLYLALAALVAFCALFRSRALSITYLVIVLFVAMYIPSHLPLGAWLGHVPPAFLTRYETLTKLEDILFIASSLLLLGAAAPLLYTSGKYRNSGDFREH